jgi:hypothetical protein
MTTSVLIVILFFLIACIVCFFKILEFGGKMPSWYRKSRTWLDFKFTKLIYFIKTKSLSIYGEFKQAILRTPHIVVHLAIVIRDKLKGPFAKYIDEVKGRKSITQKVSNSKFLNAVKDFKEEEPSSNTVEN